MKIAFISTFFTGSTLPLMKHLSEKGNQTDLYLFCKQGAKKSETFRFDKPIFGAKYNRLAKIIRYILIWILRQIFIWLLTIWYETESI